MQEEEEKRKAKEITTVYEYMMGDRSMTDGEGEALRWRDHFNCNHEAEKK